MNLRQYRRSGIVQAGEVVSDTPTDQVTVRDAYGSPMSIVVPGLAAAYGAVAGEWIILYANAQFQKLSAADFAALWEPCGGALLS